jgi:hypothetical protein
MGLGQASWAFEVGWLDRHHAAGAVGAARRMNPGNLVTLSREAVPASRMALPREAMAKE